VTWPPPVAVEPSGRLDEADVAAAVRSTRATAASGSSALTEPEARRLLATFGVPLGEAELCASAEEAVAAAERFGGPVAVKVVARGVLHKTEVGGVALDVLGEKEVRQAFDAMRARTPGLEGVLVSPMLPEPVAQVLVGARRDPGLGPVLTLGAGGVAVEILRDVVHRVLPVGPGEVRSMARALKTSPLLLGHRGAPAVDLCALEAAAAGVARCLTEVDVVTEVEVNPLYLYRDGARAVDARVLLEGDS
jgi:succinyl-CoA synthetase beta subunit